LWGEGAKRVSKKKKDQKARDRLSICPVDRYRN
jgi:hypothetical protein